MSKKKEKEEDPMYRKMCTNSSKCDQERVTATQGDMQFTYCHQCFHVLSWNKIEVEATENKKTTASTAKPKSEKLNNPTEVEAEEVEMLDIPELEVGIDDELQASKDIADEADAIQATFAEVDKIMADTNIVTPKTEPDEVEVEIEDDFNPFPEEDNGPKEGDFTILKVQQQGPEMIRIICASEGGKSRWLLDKETEASKVKMISEKPALVTNKLLRITYDRLDDLGRPINPVYVTLVKPNA